ncbi:MAG: hypothetical protein CM1200mP18_06460 [Gammaproteobacteria bacterium]|nr:MAG: hypothetical protein CM1200mP18_06460 [Gammaproteobacteria bacterium]
MKVETGIPMDNWHETGSTAATAEALGFDGALSFEIANDPFIPLALAAMATETIRLGTSIALCFPRSPMTMATSAWDLHLQSKGRFTLGLGTQVKGHNVRRFSVPWSPPQPRYVSTCNLSMLSGDAGRWAKNLITMESTIVLP